MNKLLIGCLALFLIPGVALAKTKKLTAADPVATMNFPDSWKITDIKRGFQAKSPDDEVYVWAELIAPGDVDTVQKEHDDYFAKQKVTMAKAGPEGKEVDGRKWAFITPKATYKGDPTVVRYIIINPKAAGGKLVIFTYWASPEGRQELRQRNERRDQQSSRKPR
ncbi:MAG: hypothetical protein NVS2B5_29890 [Beijerinckiaceae bacterium]